MLLKLFIYLSIQATWCLQGSLILDTLYTNTYENQTYYAFDVHAYVPNASSQTNIFDMRLDGTFVDAVTLYVFPAKITSVSTSLQYALSRDHSTLILYAENGINQTFMGSIFGFVPDELNSLFIENFKTYSLLEYLDPQFNSYNIEWKTHMTLMLRSNVHTDYEKCHWNLQSWENISYANVKYSNILQKVFYDVPKFASAGMFAFIIADSTVDSSFNYKSSLVSNDSCQNLNNFQNDSIRIDSDLVENTNIVDMNRVIDPKLHLPDYSIMKSLITMSSTFENTTCEDYLTDDNTIFEYPLKTIFDVQIRQPLIDESVKYNATDSTGSCHYKMTIESKNLTNAKQIYYYLNRLMPIADTHLIHSIYIYFVPYVSHVVTVEDLNAAEEEQSDRCEATIRVNTTNFAFT